LQIGDTTHPEDAVVAGVLLVARPGEDEAVGDLLIGCRRRAVWIEQTDRLAHILGGRNRPILWDDPDQVGFEKRRQPLWWWCATGARPNEDDAHHLAVDAVCELDRFLAVADRGDPRCRDDQHLIGQPEWVDRLGADAGSRIQDDKIVSRPKAADHRRERGDVDRVKAREFGAGGQHVHAVVDRIQRLGCRRGTG